MRCGAAKGEGAGRSGGGIAREGRDGGCLGRGGEGTEWGQYCRRRGRHLVGAGEGREGGGKVMHGKEGRERSLCKGRERKGHCKGKGRRE